MKIGRAADESDRIMLVVVGTDHAREVLGADPDDLLAIAMSRNVPDDRLGPDIAIDRLRFLSPVGKPPSIRDFSAFEAHTRNCVEARGGTMNPLWYDIPVFYFSNPQCVIDDGAEVTPPRQALSIDYELELACVIGAPISDLAEDDQNWLDHVAGFCLMNDWSARCIGAQEMKLFMGPAKAKDFATSLGPWLVTPDELDVTGSTIDLAMSARVNGALWSQGNVKDLYFPWPRLLAQASSATELVPGDVIGSGTCGTGCILELRLTRGRDQHPWLTHGDEVEFEAPKFGKLRNRIAVVKPATVDA